MNKERNEMKSEYFINKLKIEMWTNVQWLFRLIKKMVLHSKKIVCNIFVDFFP